MRVDRRGGFTLMEAMIVVSIIAITAALAAPGLSRAMADRRANEATHSMVRLGARARSEAMAYGRAHVLAFGAGTTGKGSAQLWRGQVDRCSGNDWAAIMGGVCDSTNAACVDQVDMSAYDFPSSDVRMTVDGGVTWLCFEPNGEMLVSTGGVFAINPPVGTDAVVFRLVRHDNGAPSGVARAVVFPFGGTPRMVR